MPTRIIKRYQHLKLREKTQLCTVGLLRTDKAKHENKDRKDMRHVACESEYIHHGATAHWTVEDSEQKVNQENFGVCNYSVCKDPKTN